MVKTLQELRDEIQRIQEKFLKIVRITPDNQDHVNNLRKDGDIAFREAVTQLLDLELARQAAPPTLHGFGGDEQWLLLATAEAVMRKLSLIDEEEAILINTIQILRERIKQENDWHPIETMPLGRLVRLRGDKGGTCHGFQVKGRPLVMDVEPGRSTDTRWTHWQELTE